jgi:hypothetical protein
VQGCNGDVRRDHLRDCLRDHCVVLLSHTEAVTHAILILKGAPGRRQFVEVVVPGARRWRGGTAPRLLPAVRSLAASIFWRECQTTSQVRACSGAHQAREGSAKLTAHGRPNAKRQMSFRPKDPIHRTLFQQEA